MSCCSYKAGIGAADTLLGVLGFTRVQKDITDGATFDRLVASLSLAIAEEVSGVEQKAFTRLLSLSDVAWETFTPSEMNNAIAVLESVLPSPSAIIPGLQSVLGASLAGILNQSREAVALRVGAQLSEVVNNAAVEYLRNSESLFVTDYLKRRNAAISRRIRNIVADSLAQGLTRASIVGEIARKFGPAAVLGRSAQYYDVVAGQFANQARVYGSLTAMSDAGISRYVWESVNDEVTSEYCLMMHGHVFEVAGALDIYKRLAASPEAAKQINPWVNRGKNSYGDDLLYITDAFGHRKVLAEILRPGAGEWDSPGEYKQLHSDDQLMAMGVTLPPAHANCRSVVIADI